MPSPFVDQLLKPLEFPYPIFSDTEPSAANNNDSAIRQELRSLLASLKRPLSGNLIRDTIGSLTQIERSHEADTFVTDPETDALREIIAAKILVGLYAEALDVCLSQATDADTESEWWSEVLRSRSNLAWYLLQTIPTRLLNLTRTILRTVRSQSHSISMGTLNATSFWQMFPPLGSQPHPLLKAIFPHLHHQGISVSSTAVLYSKFKVDSAEHRTLLTRLRSTLDPLFTAAKLPIALIRDECNFKRKELEKIRDQRAEVLGRLAQMRGDLNLSITKPSNGAIFVNLINAVVEGDTPKPFSPSRWSDGLSTVPLNELQRLSTTILSTQPTSHRHILDSRNLLRPSRLTLMWPKLVLLPPLCIYSLRSAYALRGTVVDLARDAKATIEGFIKGWLLEPIKDVLKTVRAGGDDGIIIQKEGIEADFASLERMTLALARDQLNYSSEQLEYLSSRIHLGDLTPVQQIYEEDIKRPLKSAVAGTLLRSVFIQVQKAKVDIDQALAGIDKLLKSQELTFAFVGVAPALGIVYLLGGSLMTLWTGGNHRNKYGSRRKMARAWSAIRQTERLLILQPGAHGSKTRKVVEDSHSLSPLTSGLLVLSVARLRTYAETCLPPRSRLRESFLEDVGDLENPDLGKEDKLRVVERMWRCWSDVFGWGRIVARNDSRL